MEPESAAESNQSREQALLLREAVEVLTSEIAIIAHARWEDLSELKKKKVVLASKLRAFPPHRNLAGSETIPSLIGELEKQSQHQISVHMRVIECQIAALHDLNQYWVECLNIPLWKYC